MAEDLHNNLGSDIDSKGNFKKTDEEVAPSEETYVTEKKIPQQEFEEMTKKGFEKVRDWTAQMHELQNKLALAEDDLEITSSETDELEDKLKQVKFGKYEEYGINKESLIFGSEGPNAFLLMSILFNQGDPGAEKFLLDKDVNVLEIAGRVGANEEWPSMPDLIATGANYLGTDYQYNPEYQRKPEHNERQQVDFMDVDAFELNKTFKEKQFEVIYCISFLGAPSHLASKSRGMETKQYDAEILNQFDHQLRDGGILILGNRERPAIDIMSELEELGYEVADFKPGVIHYIIARKKEAI